MSKASRSKKCFKLEQEYAEKQKRNEEFERRRQQKQVKNSSLYGKGQRGT